MPEYRVENVIKDPILVSGRNTGEREREREVKRRGSSGVKSDEDGKQSANSFGSIYDVL